MLSPKDAYNNYQSAGRALINALEHEYPPGTDVWFMLRDGQKRASHGVVSCISITPGELVVMQDNGRNRHIRLTQLV